MTADDLRARIDFSDLYGQFFDLPPGKTQVDVRCCFHDDQTPSLSLKLGTGQFHCKSPDCPSNSVRTDGREGGSVFDFWMLRNNCDFPTTMDTLEGMYGEYQPRPVKAARAVVGGPAQEDDPRLDPIARDVVTGFVDALQDAPGKRRRDALMRKRGWTEDTLNHFEIGWDGERYTFPVCDEGGVCRNVRRYLPGGKPKLMSYARGYGKNRLFNLDALERARENDETIVVCEGEPDCITAFQYGLNAITTTGGAGSWRDEFTPPFQSLDVILVPDADDPGRAGMQRIGQKLCGVTKSIKTVALPTDGSDLSDFLLAAVGGENEGGGADAFDELLQDAVPFEPVEPDDDAPDGDERPRIGYTARQLDAVTDESWQAIEEANKDEARLFKRDGEIIRVVNDTDDLPTIQLVTLDRMVNHLAEVATWVKTNARGDEIDASPPQGVAKNVLADARRPLPVLDRLTSVPVFGAEGTITLAPGYHASCGVYHAPAAGLSVPDVPKSPSEKDVDDARRLLLGLLEDFPLADEADVAHAACMLVEPFLRNMIDGSTPLYLVEAPMPRTGKGLLVKKLARVYRGDEVPMMPPVANDDEMRKRVTAQLLSAPSHFVLDNLTELDSPALAAAITTGWWEDRKLGSSEIIRARVTCTWVATGNNPLLTREIAHRVVRIRLDAKKANPAARQDFVHRDPLGYVDEHRSELVGAALTLGQAWVAAGKPTGDTRSTSLPQWARTMSGILTTAGIDGFMANDAELHEHADAETAAWAEFTHAWWSEVGKEKVGTSRLLPIAARVLDLGRGNRHAKSIVLGRMLQSRRDSRIGGYVQQARGKVRRAQMWSLAECEDGE